MTLDKLGLSILRDYKTKGTFNIVQKPQQRDFMAEHNAHNTPKVNSSLKNTVGMVSGSSSKFNTHNYKGTNPNVPQGKTIVPINNYSQPSTIKATTSKPTVQKISRAEFNAQDNILNTSYSRIGTTPVNQRQTITNPYLKFGGYANPTHGQKNITTKPPPQITHINLADNLGLTNTVQSKTMQKGGGVINPKYIETPKLKQLFSAEPDLMFERSSQSTSVDMFGNTVHKTSETKNGKTILSSSVSKPSNSKGWLEPNPYSYENSTSQTRIDSKGNKIHYTSSTRNGVTKQASSLIPPIYSGENGKPFIDAEAIFEMPKQEAPTKLNKQKGNDLSKLFMFGTDGSDKIWSAPIYNQTKNKSKKQNSTKNMFDFW